MKNLIFFTIFLLSISCYSQVNRYSTVTTSRYEPRSYEELSSVAMTLQKRYEANQQYLYDLKKWVLELKTQIQEQKFIGRLDGEYSVLTSMEDDDLGRATKALKQRENSIREIISEYNVWVNQNNSKNQSSSSTTQSNTKENYIQIAME